MSEKNKSISLFKAIEKKILSGKYPEGHQLLTENELAREMNVSRPTISKVYDQLKKAGLVSKKAGSGTFVKSIKKTDNLTFGLLLPGANESAIFGPICDHIAKLTEEKNIHCIWDGVFTSASLRKQQMEKICRHYIEQKVDGILFSPLERIDEKDQINEKIYDLLKTANIPVVLIDRDIYSFPQKSVLDVVGIDNFHAGFVMTEHLINQGAEKIIFIHRPSSAPTIDLRLAGYRHALTKANIEQDEDAIYEGDPAAEACTNFIKQLKKKIGIICANDSTAVALMSNLKNHKIEIGRKILISGFDNMKFANDLHVPLTTYSQPLKDISYWSIHLLLGRIKGTSAGPVQINLQGKIIVRESSTFKKIKQ